MKHLLALALSAAAIPSLLAQTSSPTVPPYYAAEEIAPPAGVAAEQMSAVAINSQGYVLLHVPYGYVPGASDPSWKVLVYKGGKLFALARTTINGEAFDAYATYISDVGPDGSYYVSGAGQRSKDGVLRPIVWRVKADNTSTAQALNNILLPPENACAGEQREGRAVAINSAGTVLGAGHFCHARVALSWQLPDPTARRIPRGDANRYGGADLDEQGNYVLYYDGVDSDYLEYNGQALPPPPGGSVNGSSSKAALKGGRITGSHFAAEQSRWFSFVYSVTSASYVTLPGSAGGSAAVESYINEAGDVVGYSSGGRLTFWKRQANGGYAGFAMDELLQAGRTPEPGYLGIGGAVRGISADGTIVVSDVVVRNRRYTALLRPGMDPRPVVTSSQSAEAELNRPFTYQITATNNPTSFAASNLPAGLQINTASGLISGTPSEVGEYYVQVSASNGQGVGPVVTQLTLTVLDPASVPRVTINTPVHNATVTEGASIVVSGTATAGNSPITDLVLTDNGTIISRGDAASSEFEFVMRGLTSGTHVLTVTATSGIRQNGAASVAIAATPRGGRTFSFRGSGNWNDAGSWTPAGVPGPGDSAVVSTGTVTLPTSATVRDLSVSGGTISGASKLTVLNAFAFASGELTNVNLAIGTGATAALFGDGAKALHGVEIENAGSFLVGGSGAIVSDGAGVFRNAGVFLFALDPAAKSTQAISFTQFFNNGGRVRLAGGSLTVSGGYVQSGGEFDLGFRQGRFEDFLAGNVRFYTGTLQGSAIIDGGSLIGWGRIAGDLRNNAGFLSPGHSAGIIEVDGNYVQGAAGTLVLEVGGTREAYLEVDKLKIGGSASFAGKLIATTFNGFAPKAGGQFGLVSYASKTGEFATTSSNVKLTLGSTGASLAFSGPNPPGPKLLNIATRMRVEQGDNALIGGFFITGSASKKVLIRALAPSLTQQGVAGTLNDPTLELDRDEGANRKFNDDWQEGDTSGIPNGFAPSDSRESVIVATLAPGPHTAIVSGKGSATGVGIVEVYDLDGAAPEALANISTRGLVQTGDNAMIGGFIIGGDQPAKVLIRAIGPSLTAQGIVGALQDTTLALVDANGNSQTNNDWRETQEGEIAATGVPPSDSKEASILATLPPGNYTAVVRGANDTIGVALVEAYNLQ